MNKNNIIQSIDWSDSFVADVNLNIPTRFEDGTVYAPGVLPDCYVRVTLVNDPIGSVLISFLSCSEIGIWFAGEIDPALEETRGAVRWRFNKRVGVAVECERITWELGPSSDDVQVSKNPK